MGIGSSAGNLSALNQLIENELIDIIFRYYLLVYMDIRPSKLLVKLARVLEL